MNKWGVRLIGCYFLIWAISDLVELIIETHSTKGFMAFHIEICGLDIAPWIGVFILFYTGFQLVRFAISGENLVFMSWVEVVVLVYISFQLLRFHLSGRYGALVVFCLRALEAGGFLIWMIIIMAKAFFDNDPRHSYDITLVGGLNPITYLLLLVGAFAYYFIPAYYLMRRDVKRLFEKADIPKETTSTPDATPS